MERVKRVANAEMRPEFKKRFPGLAKCGEGGYITDPDWRTAQFIYGIWLEGFNAGSGEEVQPCERMDWLDSL